MATFLNTTGVSSELDRLINNAEEFVWLISPYLQVNQRIRELLADKDRLKIDTRIVYGKSELSAEQRDWLSSTPSIRVSYRANLHAKCYLSEQNALLTSMNLYEFSQINNIEMGVLVDRESDGPLYEDIRQEARRILRGSEEHPPGPSTDTAPSRGKDQQTRPNRQTASPASSKKRQPRRSRSAKPSTPTKPPKRGFCIRCRGDLEADPTKPYCPTCYKSWARYKNGNYEEKHCHLCGRSHPAMLRLPTCPSCSDKHESGVSPPSG